MAKEKFPVTAGVRVLRQHGVLYEEHLYENQEHGGTRLSAESLSVPEHIVIKMLVMQDDQGQLRLMRMHGDREVSTQNLVRVLAPTAVRVPTG